jgi:hypothetical protein
MTCSFPPIAGQKVHWDIGSEFSINEPLIDHRVDLQLQVHDYDLNQQFEQRILINGKDVYHRSHLDGERFAEDRKSVV